MPVQRSPHCYSSPRPTFSRCSSVIFGPLFDYLDTSLNFIWSKNPEAVDPISTRTAKFTEKAAYSAAFYFFLGLLYMTKLDVVRYSGEQGKDLHLIVTSTDEVVYVEDIDLSVVMCKVELVDVISLVISTVMAIKSLYDSTPSNVCFFLPWLGITLKALLLNQIPTTLAFMYILLLSEQRVKLISLTSMLFVFIMEMRIWFFLAKQFYVQWRRQCVMEQRKKDQRKKLCLPVEDNARVEEKFYAYE